MAVQKNQRAVQETEHKLERLKKWDRELENLAGPLMKPVDQLRGFLATDMAKAVVYLNQAIQALEAYKKVAPPAASGAAGAPAGDTQTTP